MSKTRKNNLILFFSFVILFSIFLISDKISALTVTSFNDFKIGLSNPAPAPNEFLEASISNANFDITRANIKWILNGKILSEGKNQDKVSFTVGEVGNEYKLTAIITSPQGFSVRKTVVLNPSNIDLLWSAQTYTPYFYKGKPLATTASRVLVSVIPNIISAGKKIDSRNLYFKWFLNDDLSENGWNKDSFSFDTGVFDNQDNSIKVVISDEKGAIIQNKTITIPSRKAEISFYEYDGVYNERYSKAISNFEITAGDSARFVAEPYFAPFENPDSLKYLWTLNNREIELKRPYNILNFGTTPDLQGAAQIDLKINFNALVKEIENRFIITVK